MDPRPGRAPPEWAPVRPGRRAPGGGVGEHGGTGASRADEPPQGPHRPPAQVALPAAVALPELGCHDPRAAPVTPRPAGRQPQPAPGAGRSDPPCVSACSAPCRQGDQPGGVHLPGRMPLFGCRSPGRGVLPRLIPRRTPTLQRGSRYRRSSVTRPANDRHRRHNPMRPRPWGSVRSGLDLFPSFGAGPRHKSRPRPHFLAELTGNPAYRVADSEPAPPEVVAWDLGAGETQVITHALRHGADGLVLDDLDARRCAKAMGRSVIGTLGVVGRAKSMGRIAQFPGSKPGSCCRLDRSLFPLWLIMDSRLVRDEG